MSEEEINMAFAKLFGWTNCHATSGGLIIGISPGSGSQYEIIENYCDSHDKLIQIQEKFIKSEDEKNNFIHSVLEMAVKGLLPREGNYYYKILTLTKTERAEAILYALGVHKNCKI